MPSMPFINIYTPQKEYVQYQNDGNDISQMGNNSILNNDLSIESVLKDIGMEKYIEKFHLEEIDLFVFSHLEPEDLFELHIDEKDHEILLQAIKVYAIWFVTDLGLCNNDKIDCINLFVISWRILLGRLGHFMFYWDSATACANCFNFVYLEL